MLAFFLVLPNLNYEALGSASICDMLRLSRERSSSGTTLPDEIGQSHAVVSAAHQPQGGECDQHRFQLRHTVKVTNRVLRQRQGPTAHYCFHALG
jgi:hypothetical protein